MAENKNKKRVGILRGGKGKHYESSLAKGGEVISYFFENLSDKYKVVDIFIDKNDVWYVGGLPTKTENLAEKVDAVWNTAHSSFYDNLKDLSIPHIGSNAYSVLENVRVMLKKHINDIGINIPRHIVFPVYQKDFDGPKEKYALKKAKEVFQKFSAPWLVKSFNFDSTMGVRLAKTFPKLVDAIMDGVSHGDSILVEELISGKSASVHSVNNFRGEDVYVLPPVENRNGIIISPGNFSADEKNKLIDLSKNLHKYLDMSHYNKFDFILSPTKDIYLVDIEFLPSLKEDSDFVQSCESVGVKASSLVGHILDLSLNNQKK